MKMDYRRDLQHNYLVAEDGEDTENYITRMMTENQVQGLLGCECRRMDQKKLYYYDITSKISLAEKCRYKKIKGSEVHLVVQRLLQVLVQLEEYLIPADRICLDWNYIYLDPASGQPSFCCLPVTEKELEQGVRELLEELLPRLDHQEQDGVSVVYELYQYAVRESFSVMELQGVLERRMLEQRKSLRRESQMYGEKENSFPSENGYANTEEAGRSYLAGERKSIQEESVRSWEREKRAGKSASGREEEQFRTDRRNHERALEDFFSVEEEENETDRERNLPVGLLAGICAGVLYGLTGYAVWEYFPGYLGIWGAIGVIAALSFLIWQVTVKRRKKEDSQIAEQFAMYQEPAGKSLDFPKQAVGEWEEKEEEAEAEEVSSWENRIPWENNNYTQLLSAGRKEGGLILKELHPVSGRQFRIDKTHPTIIGQLKDQADLVLPSTAVSRVHASIEQRAGSWYLKDLNSRNGTWVNDQELYGEEEKELTTGDQIQFADLVYRVEI